MTGDVEELGDDGVIEITDVRSRFSLVSSPPNSFSEFSVLSMVKSEMRDH